MDQDSDIERVALLRESVRRALYGHVRRARDAVGRDEAAAAVGISKSLAAFHLDRMAGAGLLEVEYRRLSGKTGPGAGRPAKLYRPSAHRVLVTLPESRYGLLAELLARALEGASGRTTPQEAIHDAARSYGASLGSEPDPQTRSLSALGRMEAVLEHLGFEPERRPGLLALRNCPFHEVREGHTGLVCGMNRALIGGIADGLGAASDVVAETVDEAGSCCVAVRERA